MKFALIPLALAALLFPAPARADDITNREIASDTAHCYAGVDTRDYVAMSVYCKQEAENRLARAAGEYGTVAETDRRKAALSLTECALADGARGELGDARSEADGALRIMQELVNNSASVQNLRSRNLIRSARAYIYGRA